MDEYLNGDIIPGERVGNFFLGWSLEELLSNISWDYTMKDADRCKIIECRGIRFFVLKPENYLQHIAVYEDYKGKFLDKIGIGAILSEFKDILKYEIWDEESMDFEFCFPEYDGIYVTLQGFDNEDTPIKHISIFKPINEIFMSNGIRWPFI